MKSGPKAGVEFSGCDRKEGCKTCVYCLRHQREKCELLARLDKHYSDDPRNAYADRR